MEMEMSSKERRFHLNYIHPQEIMKEVERDVTHTKSIERLTETTGQTLCLSSSLETLTIKS
jgi:hypothetical protein